MTANDHEGAMEDAYEQTKATGRKILRDQSFVRTS